jgi:tetratricopeptide (TPR) repeat protein
MLAGILISGLLSTCRGNKREQQHPEPLKTPVAISMDYPVDGSIFPPEFPAPTWSWRDSSDKATTWDISIAFADGSAPLHTISTGERMRVGEIDQRCVSSSNKLPELTPEQTAAHTWTPDPDIWSAMKAHSVAQPATVVITGLSSGDSKRIVSRGQVSIRTSKDPVGAPIFYRDVPLMPSESEKGVIKPLASEAIPLIAWRLRDVAEKKSRVLMEGLHTCANCHSFAADGKTLAMDMDGPRNEKGLYAIAEVKPKMSIGKENLVEWSTFRGKLGSKLRVGFMSQISPDGRTVITSVNDPGIDQSDYERRKDPQDLVRNYYVANFLDYRFLQVFYPTRGALAWYSQKSGHLQALPGADDPRYVQANAVWSPCGKYLVFARARAMDAYPAGDQKATYANDPKETQIKYDLFRIPFNGGKGGTAEPIAGASQNGMSNSFPKISPDGRWIVFVQAQNAMLMRPDGQLFIVPATGGKARRMNCNTPLMNSWHSFSPNGRWMVFSSKSRSPFTQMYLTHIDESGEDSPPVLIENATAANRAVNIPEFVNIPSDGLETIETPVADYARHAGLAVEAMKKHLYSEAVEEWKRAFALDATDPHAHNNFGVALMETGQTDQAIEHYRKALEIHPKFSEACNNLGEALAGKGADKEAIVSFEKALRLDPGFTVARQNLGMVLARTGQTDKAIDHMKKVVEEKPDVPENHRNLGHALATKGAFREASAHLEEAVRLSGRKDPLALFLLGRVSADLGKRQDAVQYDQEALGVATRMNNADLVQAISAHLQDLLGTR